jgi:hypothetical protein
MVAFQEVARIRAEREAYRRDPCKQAVDSVCLVERDYRWWKQEYMLEKGDRGLKAVAIGSYAMNTEKRLSLLSPLHIMKGKIVCNDILIAYRTR